MVETTEDSQLSIPIKTLVMLGAAIVAATTGFFSLESRIVAIEHDREMRRVEIDKNSEFRELWPAGRWGSGSLPADQEQFLRIEGHDRDIAKLYELHDEIVSLKIQLGSLQSEIRNQENGG